MSRNRQLLANGIALEIGDKKYRILDLMSENGASCLVYMAEVLSNRLLKRKEPKNQIGINSSTTKFVIKEFYPKEYSQYIQRDKSGKLIVADMGQKLFNNGRMRFTGGIARQVAISYADSNNSTLGRPEAYTDVNGTAYSILKLGIGTTLKDADRSALSVCEIAQIMVSLCDAISELHIRNQLYLDVKPSNIFLFDKIMGESRRISLFDFDTVYEKGNLPHDIPYSPQWAPDEQCLQRIEEITEATDVYAIGAVFYWLLTGEKVSEDTPTYILNDEFTFLNRAKILIGKESLIEQTKNILTCMLNREPNMRTNNLGKIMYMFEDLEHISNDTGSGYYKHYLSKSSESGIGLEQSYMVGLMLKNRQKQINGGKK